MDKFNFKQKAFQEIFIGTLIFASVLGIFNDYTGLVYAKSFSTILLASFVLELLTFTTFWVKRQVVRFVLTRFKTNRRFPKLLSVWPIAFFSKFIFIWVLDILFSDYILVQGFLGILLVVLTVVIIQSLSLKIFWCLGNK